MLIDENTKMVDAVIGPYRGRRLVMTPAEHAQAIADNWAVDAFGDPFAPPEILDDVQTHAAYNCAVNWQQQQLALAAGEEPGAMAASAREMKPADDPAGTYQTRATTTRRR